MLVFEGIVIIALAAVLMASMAVAFVVVSFMRAAPMIACRAGRSIDMVMVGGPRRPQRLLRGSASRGVQAVHGALQPA